MISFWQKCTWMDVAMNTSAPYQQFLSHHATSECGEPERARECGNTKVCVCCERKKWERVRAWVRVDGTPPRFSIFLFCFTFLEIIYFSLFNRPPTTEADGRSFRFSKPFTEKKSGAEKNRRKWNTFLFLAIEISFSLTFFFFTGLTSW